MSIKRRSTYGVKRSSSKYPRIICGQKTSTYACWQDIKTRCYNKNHKAYNYYGARGVVMCDRWLESYDNFVDDMGERPEGLTLDKDSIKKGNLVYCKEFCCWITHKENLAHRRTSRFIEFGGMVLSQNDWSRFLTLPVYTIANIFRGEREKQTLNFIRKTINQDGFKPNLHY